MSTTMKNQVDPIIEEIHEIRREIARRFAYDAHQISADAKRRQLLEGRPLWKPQSTNVAMPLSGGGTISNSGLPTPAG